MKESKDKLWTYDFTVITVGSFISMVGSTLSSFALGLVVLEYTGSTFLYALFIVGFQAPQLIFPVLAGTYLDRVSRKKVIYALDFLSAGIYFLLFLLVRGGWFSYPVLLGGSLLIGTVESVYMVAYESFYPNLITEGNSGKAYSVYSVMYELASMTAPLAAALYVWLNSAAPLFAVNAASFFIAACLERTIRCRESHMGQAPAGPSPAVQFRRDFREGVDYIRRERGLLMIVLYFTAVSFSCGADSLKLPFFRNNAALFAAWPVAAVTLYSVVTNFDVAGRVLGGFVQYKIRIPKERRFDTALLVYIATTVLMAVVLYTPVPVMAALFFINGGLGVTSYTIRTAATQTYVPDAMRGRFNGVFQTLASLGAIAGSLLAGALGEVFPERRVILGMSAVTVAAMYFFIWRGREDIKQVYNREV